MGLDTENVILANDLAFMPERNWIVFRNGQYPVWNRDETVTPMAYRPLAAGTADAATTTPMMGVDDDPLGYDEPPFD
ncbi:MAG: hypothetical protein LBE08_00050 [Bifidobacteriaceae bacterium]|jgi:hypothetical protein|nr:hypothetical protein [Bifidobacteriaceae bacterium]